MSRARLGVALACVAALALVAAAPIGAQPGAASPVRKAATLTVAVPEAGAVTLTRFTVRLTRPGASRSVAGSLTVASDYGRIPPGATVLVRLRPAGPGSTTIEVVVARRKAGAIPTARTGGLTAGDSVDVDLVAEAQRRFVLRVKEVSRWRSSRLFDRPAPICRPGSPAIRPAFLFLGGRPNPVAEPALPEGSTWAQLLPGMLCAPSPGSIGVLNPAGCAFTLERTGTGDQASLAGWCGSALRELRISSPAPFATLGEISLTGPGGGTSPGTCRLEGGAIVCPVLLTGPVGISASLAAPGVPLDVEVVPVDSPRAVYRLA